MMSQKQPKPMLTGQRLKTRKRDEKETFEPTAFRDKIVQGLNEQGNDLEAISKYLIQQGSRLDYRRYAETLLDILIAGGMLAPGGSVIEDADKTKTCRLDVCVFTTPDDVATMRTRTQIFERLIRQYKYLEKSLDDEMKKVLTFLQGFSDEERARLATFTFLVISTGLVTSNILTSLFHENLVEEGIGLDFATAVFKMWLSEKDFNSLISILKKADIDQRLPELFPANKRSPEHPESHFRAAGLGPVADYLKGQQNRAKNKELKKKLADMISNENDVKEIIIYVKDYMKKNELAEHEVVVLVWFSVMKSVEWNKEEDLVAEQAIRHLTAYAPLLAALTTQGRSELDLLVKIQNYCYDNMQFMKVFHKILVLLYEADVFSKDVILKWHKDGHSPKGKSVFLEQTKEFVEQLQSPKE
ncbi:basic leucine zipper and W2 domain-containing protein 1-like [Branchiostoma floridae]|uniref:Basic leucine zipper and W2 domain-containing protein 1-like n=1 Tax=Branchiostoma floridae TaxID=7739 RepID=A0A9J7NBK9_BRAFL|nr:basic leucine zipper and W2 domain-containing protein 1-like [Branchiostoma floridae]XP_035700263.1 basic leucine zipper and W2 domain-containing protein 1-like [Branchiostoma floridae]